MKTNMKKHAELVKKIGALISELAEKMQDDRVLENYIAGLDVFNMSVDEVGCELYSMGYAFGIDRPTVDWHDFIEAEVNKELKWVYHFDTDDEMFGVQTDRLRLFLLMQKDKSTLKSCIEYLERSYPADEERLIAKLKMYL